MGSGKCGLYSGTYGSDPVNGYNYNSAVSNTIKTPISHSISATVTPNNIPKSSNEGKLYPERYSEKSVNDYLDNNHSDYEINYTNPIDEDETEYNLTIYPIPDPILATVNSIAQILGCNFENAKSMLIQNGITKSEKAPAIQNIAKLLSKSGVNFFISPEFPYDVIP